MATLPPDSESSNSGAVDGSPQGPSAEVRTLPGFTPLPTPSPGVGAPTLGQIPPPPSAPSRSPSTPTDDLALAENNALASGRDLEQEAAVRDHYRTETLRDLVAQAAKGMFIILACLMVIAVVFWSWHVLMPESMAFLSDKQLDKIQSILTTIGLSGLVAGYARKVMKAPGK